MNEIVTIAAADRAAADAQFSLEESNRPNTSARIMRRGLFQLGRFNLVPDVRVRGRAGGAEKADGSSIYLIVVEFATNTDHTLAP